MTRPLILVCVLLLGLAAIHTAGTRRPRAPVMSDDPYAWLGPAPSNIDDAGLERRWERLVKEMVEDARTVDLRRFACRSPAEVGTLPMMQAVIRYADGLPGSGDDEALVDGLSRAAARGNWRALRKRGPLPERARTWRW